MANKHLLLLVICMLFGDSSCRNIVRYLEITDRDHLFETRQDILCHENSF